MIGAGHDRDGWVQGRTVECQNSVKHCETQIAYRDPYRCKPWETRKPFFEATPLSGGGLKNVQMNSERRSTRRCLCIGHSARAFCNALLLRALRYCHAPQAGVKRASACSAFAADTPSISSSSSMDPDLSSSMASNTCEDAASAYYLIHGGAVSV